MRPIEEWADLKYKPKGVISHIVPWGQPHSLCGEQAFWGFSEWHGTGSMEERERAASLPTCGRCQVEAND
jgi:hypothetical protein